MKENGMQSNPGHETTDAAVKPVVGFLLGLALLIVVAMVLMAVLYDYLGDRLGRSSAEVSPLIDTRQIPPGPRLQVTPSLDIGEIVEWEHSLLNSYEWLDKDTGFFRIPVERAMDIIAENGLPAREEVPGQ